MSKVEKKEGATMDCGSCGLRLICRNKTYEAYEDHPKRTVLQWQNDKGGAHYKWIGPEKFKCVDESGVDIPLKKSETTELPAVGEPIKEKPLDESTLGLIKREATLLFKIKEAINKTIKEISSTEPHPGMIWQMTELIYKKRLDSDLP